MQVATLARQIDEERGGVKSIELTGLQVVTDSPLAERVERELGEARYAALRAVEVSVRGQVVELRGHVPSFYMKQMAQVVTMAVRGVQELRNAIEVTHNGEGG